MLILYSELKDNKSLVTKLIWSLLIKFDELSKKIYTVSVKLERSGKYVYIYRQWRFKKGTEIISSC